MIVVGVILGLFSGFIAYLTYPLNRIPSGVSQITVEIIICLILGLSLFSAVLMLWMSVSFRIFTLTDDKLIFTRPLFFYKRTISLSDIQNIRQSDSPISMGNKSIFDNNNTVIYNGRKTIVELKNGRRIRFTSLEVGGYKDFTHKLIMKAGKVKVHPK